MKRVSLLLLLVACPFVVGLRAQDPVPEFYGVYALENGKLTEFQENANLNDFGPAVRIIVFGKGLWGPASGLFFLPPSKPKAADDGQFKGWDDFWKQSQEFGKAMDKAMVGLPPDAVSVPFQIGPYANKDDMFRVVPRQELPAGLYQLAKGVRFWVRRSQVAGMYAQTQVNQGGSTGRPTTQASPSPSAPRTYPISSGLGSFVYLEVVNRAFGRVQMVLDGKQPPIELGGGGYKVPGGFEIGSTHHIRAVIGKKVFEKEFTIPSRSFTISISSSGIQ